MDITIYLPDELGQWAKDAGLNLSQTLRSEVEAERHRRTAVDQTLESAGVVRLRVEGRDGRTYTARLHATTLHEETGDVQAYLGEDGRVYVYDERDSTLHTHDTSVDPGRLAGRLPQRRRLHPGHERPRRGCRHRHRAGDWLDPLGVPPIAAVG